MLKRRPCFFAVVLLCSNTTPPHYLTQRQWLAPFFLSLPSLCVTVKAFLYSLWLAGEVASHTTEKSVIFFPLISLHGPPEGTLRSANLGFHLQVLGKDGGVPDVIFFGHLDIVDICSTSWKAFLPQFISPLILLRDIIVSCIPRRKVLLSVADPDPGSGAFLTPGSGNRDPGWVESQDPDPGWRQFGSGMEKSRILDPR
jgi:hypothetical protein